MTNRANPNKTTTLNLDFKQQAEQILKVVEARLKTNQPDQRRAALNLMLLKFKSLYEQGVSSGRLYEREGIYPYSSITDKENN